MATATNKQTLLTHVHNHLKKKYALEAPESKPILEELIYSLLREGTTADKAEKAYNRLLKQFFDWNEIRVSTPGEIAECIRELPDAITRAQRIIGVLHEWFELTFTFSMEDLAKKGVKEGARKISRLKDANEFSVAWVVQRGLGGHAIPLDTPTIRCLHRLGAIDDPTDSLDAISGSLEHFIPKTKGPLITDLVSQVAGEICLEKPKCDKCPLKGDCAYAKAKEKASTAETKPRKSR
jgi:endonuclease III